MSNKRLEQIKAYGQMIDLGPDVSNLISAADVSANYVKKTVYNQKVQQIDASLGQRPKLSDVSSGFVSKEDWNTIFSNTDDSDKIINKWKDVTDFLEGMSEDTSLGEILMEKADKNDISTFMTEKEVADYVAEHAPTPDLSDYYTKSQIDTSIAGNYYDKTQIDNNYYTKAQSDTSIANNYYSKAAADGKFAEIVLIDKAVVDEDPTMMNDTSIYFIVE